MGKQDIKANKYLMNGCYAESDGCQARIAFITANGGPA
jgi:hypothetical protein